LKKYRHGLKAMSGGFTLSGGEPLMQHRFATKLFSAAKDLGIHTALDTNGFLGDRLSDDELQAIDLVILDIKSWDNERHRALTGVDIAPTLNFAQRLAARKRPIWLRYVLVPGVTDNMEDVEGVAAFAAQLGTVERVDVLPFHQLGKHKWKQLGMTYALETIEPPPPQLVERVCTVFRAHGLRAY
jgi:pyruvate formate lyase activating enzyme